MEKSPHTQALLNGSPGKLPGIMFNGSEAVYKRQVLEGTGYNGYILKDAPVKVMQFGEGNVLRAFVDYFYDIANEKAGYNGKVKLVQPISNFPQMADKEAL